LLRGEKLKNSVNYSLIQVKKTKFDVIRRSLALLAKSFTDTEISHFQSDHGGSEE